MLWVLLPLLAGIVCATLFPLPLLWSLGLFGLLLLLALWRVEPLALSLIFLFGYFISSLSVPEVLGELPSNSHLTLRIEKGGQATLVGSSTALGEWSGQNSKVMVWGASELDYSTVVARCRLIPFSNESGSYYRTLHRKGFSGGVTIEELLSVTPNESTPLEHRMNLWAVGRLESLGLSAGSLALAQAVGLARREALGRDLVESYNRSGTAHLLALSGLHLGVVMAIISLLTYFLPLIRYGHVIAPMLSIIAIWLFAFMAGLGQSVQRAAWMFSLLQLSAIFSRRYNSLNSLFLSAVMILSFDPMAAYDLGLALSFVAVLAILTVALPLYGRLRTGRRWLDFLLCSMVIGIVATISTAPLISHAFGYVVLLSPLTTLPLLLPLTVIIAATTLWIVIPLPLLAPIFWWVIEVACTLQNYFVEWFARLGVGYIDYRLSTFGVVATYLFMALSTLLVRYYLNRYTEQELISRELSSIED